MRVRQLMIEQGFPFATFTIALEAETGDTAALIVRIVDEGAPGTLSDCKVTGLTRHSEEQLLDYLGLKQGSSINAQMLNDVHAKLRESCRFWGHKVLVRVPDVSKNRYGESPKGIELAIDLTEYENVPPLGLPLSAEEESMIRFAHWLERHGVERFSESGDLVIQSSLPSVEADTNFRCVISPQQGMLLDANGEIGNLYAIHHTVIAAPGRAELVNWSRKSKLTADSPSINSVINIKWTPGNVENDEYRSSLVLAPGLSQKHDNSKAWSIVCDPVAAVHLLYREDAKHECADGELHVRSADTELCIEEATGRLKHMSLKGLDGQNLSAKASFESGAFERAAQDIRNRSRTYTECYDIDEPVLSSVKFAIDEMHEQPFVQQSQLRQVIFSSLQRDLDRTWLEKLASTVPINKEDKSSTEFEIPAIETNLEDGERIEFLANVMQIIPAVADQLFPRGSWPWTYTREAVFYYAGSKPRSSWDSKSEIFWEGAQSEIRRVIDTTDPGLLASLVPLLLFQEYLPGEAIEILVQRGHQSLNVESFTSDIRLLAHNEPISDLILVSFVLQTDELSNGEREALRGELPPMAATLIDMLVDRRQNHADESAPESLEAVIQEAWSAGLSDSLAEFLDSFGK